MVDLGSALGSSASVEEAAPGRGSSTGAATICEECFEKAMRSSAEPAAFESQYRMWHIVRHGGTPSVTEIVREDHLSEMDEEVLRFERFWWRRPGAKMQAIADTFGLTQIGYLRHLNALLSLQSALKFDPPLVNRLRRLRDEQVRLRLAGR